MMPLHALLALDIARERSDEARRLSEQRRDALLAAQERAEHAPIHPVRPNVARRSVAGVLHLVDRGAGGLARSAHQAASRLDDSATHGPAPAGSH
jgi:hypothetical protein